MMKWFELQNKKQPTLITPPAREQAERGGVTPSERFDEAVHRGPFKVMITFLRIPLNVLLSPSCVILNKVKNLFFRKVK